MKENTGDIYSGLAGKLPTRLVGRKVYYYRTLPSTMDVAREKGLEKELEGLVVVAGQQTGGRGRKGRFWLSPEGSLAISILCYPEKSQVAELVMCGALSVLATIEHFGVENAGIKWPNDVLIGNKKVSGILVESQIMAETVTYAIIGMGINVNSDMSVYNKMTVPPTSLACAIGKEIDMRAVFCKLIENTDKLYTDLKNNISLLDQWKSRLITLGREVIVERGSTDLRGLARDVTPDGNLILQLESGKQVIISAGDVKLE
ncbi:MAG: biotin--[acetyl-CoA-carboxylase] ligase [Dehalococcoidales bacterium]|nr:biotin--[acetyl-CoA-carboxylase] ligase [Dehalococcoidales bacterium]